MENRCLLSVVNWTGGGDGTSWTDAANWDGNLLPTLADDVVIDIAGEQTVSIADGKQAAHSLIANDVIIVSGGSLQVETTAAVNASLTLG